MILIADSGSTKTQWCLLQGHELVNEIYTDGINPYYQTETEITEMLKTQIFPLFEDVSAVYFYGAGCALPDKKQTLANAVRVGYPQAKLVIESDLLAVARGLLGHESGIACILGTGSNSCVYDGKEIVENVAPLGFILGDEGSGAALGKKLIADLLKNQLPENLRKHFFDFYKFSYAEILDAVYKQAFPNRYLAQFSRFIYEHIHEPALRQLVRTSFEEFIHRNVHQYDYQKYKIVFAGSVAYYFREILCEVATNLGLQIDAIETGPMSGLIKYHAEEAV